MGKDVEKRKRDLKKILEELTDKDFSGDCNGLVLLEGTERNVRVLVSDVLKFYKYPVIWTPLKYENLITNLVSITWSVLDLYGGKLPMFDAFASLNYILEVWRKYGLLTNYIYKAEAYQKSILEEQGKESWEEVDLLLWHMTVAEYRWRSSILRKMEELQGKVLELGKQAVDGYIIEPAECCEIMNEVYKQAEELYLIKMNMSNREDYKYCATTYREVEMFMNIIEQMDLDFEYMLGEGDGGTVTLSWKLYLYYKEVQERLRLRAKSGKRVTGFPEKIEKLFGYIDNNYSEYGVGDERFRLMMEWRRRYLEMMKEFKKFLPSEYSGVAKAIKEDKSGAGE